MLAIAAALEGRNRAEAARLAGMERQALRDAVIRYNAEGLDGLRDRPRPGRRPALTDAEQAVLLAAVFRGPERARYGCTDWTLPALCRWIEDRFGKRLHPVSPVVHPAPSRLVAAEDAAAAPAGGRESQSRLR
jgi:transposase